MNISIKVIYAVWQEFELLDCQIHIDVWSIESNFSFAQLMFKMKRELISIAVNTNVRQCFCIGLLQNWWLGWSWIFCGELVYICRSLGLEFGLWDTCPKNAISLQSYVTPSGQLLPKSSLSLGFLSKWQMSIWTWWFKLERIDKK